MKRLILLLMFLSVPGYCADGEIYKDAIVVTTVKETEPGRFELVFPVKVYGYNVYKNNRDLSDYLYASNSSNSGLKDGDEVLAKIDYKAEDDAVVKAFNGNLGAKPNQSESYIKHYSTTNIEKDILYDGDKPDEKADFCEAISLK